jgi:hypothetical protein
VELVDVSLFNPADQFEYLIVWRSLEVLDELEVLERRDERMHARHVLLDLHDMPRPHDMSERRLGMVDRLMLKSDFQRRALPERASTLAASVIPNGVDEELIARVRAAVAAAGAAAAGAAAAGAADHAAATDTSSDTTAKGSAPARSRPQLVYTSSYEARSRPQLVYTSSYDRGLEQMLRFGWPLLSAAVPGATLHLYYGWRTHELLYPVSSWREQMRALIASHEGRVIDHGRVGQPELLHAKARAQMLYYVGHWPEIDCIAAREAAMLGCVPLTSSVAVFGDPAKDYCVRVPGDPMLPETQRVAAMRAAELLQTYERTGELPNVDTPTLRSESWKAVAARWLEVMP